MEFRAEVATGVGPNAGDEGRVATYSPPPPTPTSSTISAAHIPHLASLGGAIRRAPIGIVCGRGRAGIGAGALRGGAGALTAGGGMAMGEAIGRGGAETMP